MIDNTHICTISFSLKSLAILMGDTSKIKSGNNGQFPLHLESFLEFKNVGFVEIQSVS